MPVLLYDSENWILLENCQDQLSSFLGEIAKRALKWPKHFSNSVAHWQQGWRACIPGS